MRHKDGAGELTQVDSVRPFAISSALLHQRGKGHRQDVFALPRALTGPDYLGQLHKQITHELNAE